MSAQLREQTAQAHLAVEEHFALERRLVDETAYGALLVALRSFYQPTEEALRSLPGWDRLAPRIDLEARRRGELLDDDLSQLGVTAAASDPPAPSPVPAPSRSPGLGSLADGLGVLYVLEGSALGGRIVARRARAALGPTLPVAFFSSTGRLDLAADWRSLQAALNAFGARQPAQAASDTVSAALRTFAGLGQWLQLQLT